MPVSKGSSRRLTAQELRTTSTATKQRPADPLQTTPNDVMTAHLKAYPLPTLDSLGVSADAVPDTVDANAVATEWLAAFATALHDKPQTLVETLFIPNCNWRDMLALTWDFRSLHGPAIQTMLNDRLSAAGIVQESIKLTPDSAALLRPYPDIAWISALFTFRTSLGFCSGVFRLVPTSAGQWKAHCMYTNLDDLVSFPELAGPLRNPAPNHGKWMSGRAAAVKAYETESPVVLIIGAGHSGLDLGARLKALGVRTLLVEKNPRIGDNWRNRYEALCLHDPVWYDHMPYLPFPSTWPVYAPAMKLGNWLENYVDALELDVWTSATVISARPKTTGSDWTVVVSRPNVPDRTFTVKHVVFATGFGDASASIPTYPGMNNFKGQILHSTQHKRALDHAGKKVLVVGACTSAHDIASDYYENGVDITLYQRSSSYILSTKNGWNRIMNPIYWEGGPPSDVADRLNASFPHFMAVELNRRLVEVIAEDDKEILEGLKRVGFRLNKGVMDAGFALSAWSKAGGYYIDVGASQLIIDGKIKLKNDSQIETFTPTGLKFENGSELEVDVVVFATGVGDVRASVRKLCGDAVADQCSPIWGLDAEGEINGAWRDLGIQGLWCMMGNLALSRFHSKHIALQIKAMEEGIWDGSRYSLKA
ncbi:Flavin-containing monooxygenase [Mycena kentingensis (nom. inval.)]|nr:Flavin-containing monooxygenase [Mycena kentingensis (nom. inval.)]